MMGPIPKRANLPATAAASVAAIVPTDAVAAPATDVLKHLSRLFIKSPYTPPRIMRRLRGGSLADTVGDRIVMITGASSGIGRAAALHIASAGGTVLLVARTPEKLEATKAEIETAGGAAHVYPCDLTDPDDIDRMAAEVLDQHGHVDIVINNAGRSIRRSVALSYDRIHDYERTMQLNYFGAVKLTLAVLPGMRARKWGHIINISSIGVEMNMPRFSAYVASKAALDAFSACLAGEVHDDGVRITTIYMPLVRTPMIAPTTMYKSFPTLTTDEAADIIEEAIVTRPKHIGTRVGSMFGIAYALNAGAVDGLVNIAYHLFPESKAASADSGRQGGGQERPPDAPMLARWLRDPIGRRGARTERNHSQPHTQVRPGHAKRSAAARGSST